MTQPTERKPLDLPQGQRKVLLHSCCASCAGEVMAAMPPQLRREPSQWCSMGHMSLSTLKPCCEIFGVSPILACLA